MSRSVPPVNHSVPGNVAATPQSSSLQEVDLEGLLAEGEALRGLLYEAYNRLGRLLAGLKRHRRQAKAVKTALASLRPFQRVILFSRRTEL